MWKVGQKQPFFFQMSAILKLDFQKWKQLRFSEVNYLKYTQKRLNFACSNYIFPKTRGNKNKPWTHSIPLLFGVYQNGNFLTSPTFECTPDYAPVSQVIIYFLCQLKGYWVILTTSFYDMYQYIKTKQKTNKQTKKLI